MGTLLRFTLLLCLSAMVLTTVGCGRSDLPPLGTVRGTVTLEGKPAAGLIVSFAPEKGRAAVGTADAAGNYALTYVHGTNGAQVGPATVNFAWPDGVEGKPPIPAKFLGKSAPKVEVKAGKNTFDFDLKK